MALAASTLTLFGDIASHLVCLKIGMYHYFEDQILGKNEDERHWLLDLPSISIPPHETNMVVSPWFSLRNPSNNMGEPIFFGGGCLEQIKGNCGYTSTDAGFASGLFMIGAVTNGAEKSHETHRIFFT